MGWRIFDEAVEMVDRRFQYFPRVFRWRGQRYEIDAVERCWTVTTPGWRRRREGHYFQVRCGEGTFELFQDLGASTWHLRRAKLASSRAIPERRLVPAWR